MIFCPENVKCLPSAAHKLRVMGLQNREISFADKTRFPSVYYVICVKINERTLYENTYVGGVIEATRLREESVICAYDDNCYLAFFPKDKYSEEIEYQIAFEDNQWMVFEIDSALTEAMLVARNCS